MKLLFLLAFPIQSHASAVPWRMVLASVYGVTWRHDAISPAGRYRPERCLCQFQTNSGEIITSMVKLLIYIQFNMLRNKRLCTVRFARGPHPPSKAQASKAGRPSWWCLEKWGGGSGEVACG